MHRLKHVTYKYTCPSPSPSPSPHPRPPGATTAIQASQWISMVSTADGVTLAKALGRRGGRSLNLSFATNGGVGQMVAIDAQSRLQASDEFCLNARTRTPSSTLIKDKC